MIEVSEKFIIEAHKVACADWKKRIESEFPSLFGPPKIGDFIRVISGGSGAYCADGVCVFWVNKPNEKPKNYGGQYWDSESDVYVVSDGGFYGLCYGFKIEKVY
jgi:hypothetical protein